MSFTVPGLLLLEVQLGKVVESDLWHRLNEGLL
jgi:hypothetical protein